MKNGLYCVVTLKEDNKFFNQGDIAMNKIDDDQLGKLYRRMQSLAGQVGTSLSYSHVMETLHRLSDRTLRTGVNTTEDIQQLFQRSAGTEDILAHFRDVRIPSFSAKTLSSCFANKKRYPNVFEVAIKDERYISWPDILPGQPNGKIRVFKMKGMASHSQLASELLGVSDETPDSWLQQLLVRRGYTLTLPAIEGIIDLATSGSDMALASFPGNNPCFHPCNLAFVEVIQGEAKTVDVVYFSRQTKKQWDVSRYAFTRNAESCMKDRRLVTRIGLKN